MGALSGVQALTMLCSVIRNKLIAVWIGPVGIGLVILYNSVTDLVGVTSRLNIDQSSVREIAAASDDPARISYTVRMWSLALGLLAWLFMCAASPVLSQWSFGDTSHWLQFCILGCCPFLFTIAVGYQAVMKGLRQFGRLARVNLSATLSALAVSVPLIWWLRADSIIWVIVTYTVCQFVCSYLLRVRLPRVRMNARQVWQAGRVFISLGAAITIGSAMTYLCNYLFVLFMNDSASTGQLGLYQAGFTLINSYVGVFFTGVWIEYFPRLSAAVHSRRATEITVSHRIATTAWILIPVMPLFMACDDLIVRVIYAESFLGMIPFITLGMAAMGLRAASWCIQHTVLARGDGKIYVLTEAVSAVICLAVNTVSYARWGFYGLGVSYIVWYGLFLLLVWWFYRHFYGYRLRGRVMFPALAGTIIAIVCAVCRLCVDWWIPLAVGLAALPVALKYLKK